MMTSTQRTAACTAPAAPDMAHDLAGHSRAWNDLAHLLEARLTPARRDKVLQQLIVFVQGEYHLLFPSSPDSLALIDLPAGVPPRRDTLRASLQTLLGETLVHQVFLALLQIEAACWLLTWRRTQSD
jgi:hypothetical protein